MAGVGGNRMARRGKGAQRTRRAETRCHSRRGHQSVDRSWDQHPDWTLVLQVEEALVRCIQSVPWLLDDERTRILQAIYDGNHPEADFIRELPPDLAADIPQVYARRAELRQLIAEYYDRRGRTQAVLLADYARQHGLPPPFPYETYWPSLEDLADEMEERGDGEHAAKLRERLRKRMTEEV